MKLLCTIKSCACHLKQKTMTSYLLHPWPRMTHLRYICQNVCNIKLRMTCSSDFLLLNRYCAKFIQACVCSLYIIYHIIITVYRCLQLQIIQILSTYIYIRTIKMTYNFFWLYISNYGKYKIKHTIFFICQTSWS